MKRLIVFIRVLISIFAIVGMLSFLAFGGLIYGLYEGVSDLLMWVTGKRVCLPDFGAFALSWVLSKGFAIFLGFVRLLVGKPVF